MYGFKECSSCGALYNKEHCCSNVSSVDNFVRDPTPISYDETPDSSKQPPRNCSKCGGPFGGLYCRQCTCERCRGNYTDEVCALCCYRSFVNDSNPNSFIDSPNNFNPPSQHQTSSLDQFPCFHCKDPLERGECCKRCSCKWCGSGLSEGFCFICASNNKNSSISDPNPNSFNDSQNLSDYPPQPQYQTNSCELCGNDAHYGYECPPQVSFHAFKEKQHQPEDIQELLHKLLKDLQMISEELAEEYLENSSNAITPDLPTEEPDNSLSMGDEHLSTIPEMGSDEVIKSSVEDLVPIPSESEGIFDNTCDVPFCDNSPPLDVLNDHFEIFSDFNDDYTSSDDDFYEDIDYVEASPPDSELASLEEVKDNILREKLLNINLLIAKIESLNDNLTPDCVLKSPSLFPIPVEDSDSFFEKSDTSLSYSDNSLPEFETFSDHTEETSSGSTTTHTDNSLPKYDSFLFEIKPDQGELTIVVIEDILGEPRVHVNELPTHPTLMLDSDFIPFDDSFGSDLEVSFPFGTRNKIFDLGIFFEVQSKRFISQDTFSISFIRNILCPFIKTLLPFSSENEDTVFNPGILPSNLLSRRGKITSDFSKSPMMISGGDIPFLAVLFLHFYPP
ncbi:hypothetical protein Tco_1475232 [Tanacetum coccineum]